MTDPENPSTGSDDAGSQPAESAPVWTGAAAGWMEDPDLATAVAEVEEFTGSAGWDAPPQLFALVRTRTLVASEPQLGPSLDGAGTFTAIAQDALPVETGQDDAGLADALARISWPTEVGGCILAQEIVVLPPAAAQTGGAGPGAELTSELAAAHPDRREARLVVGVLRGRPGGACLLRVREGDDPPLRGGDLAPNLIAALQATFDEDVAF